MTKSPPDDPAVVASPAQPFVGITRTVTMQTIPEIADRIPVLIGWLAERGVAVAGAPFLRYLVIDMAGGLQVQAGVPVAVGGIEPDGDVRVGVLPAGRYAVTTHRGHPDRLVDVTAALLAWAQDEGLALDVATEPDGEHWACRLETYLTNPVEEPDPQHWETVVSMKLAD